MKGKMIFSIGSLNECIRIKKYLAASKVEITPIKLDNSKSGCAYGIEFYEKDLYHVVHILSQHNINYKPYKV